MSNNISYVPASAGFYIIENVDGELIKGQTVLAWQIEITGKAAESEGGLTRNHVTPVTISKFSDDQYFGIIEPSGRVNSVDGIEFESLEDYQKSISQ